MDPKKKGLALLVLEHAKSKKGEKGYSSESEDDDEPEGDADAGLESAMGDFIAAVHAKDEGGAVEAFKALMECHSSEE